MRALIVAVAVALWEILANAQVLNSFFVSSPSLIAALLLEWAREGVLSGGVIVTLAEAIIGYVAAVIVGLAFGVGMATVPAVSRVLDPYLTALNALPRLLLGPLLIAWFGFGLESKVVFVFVVVFFIIYFGVLSGISQVSSTYVNAGRLLGANRRELMVHVYLPASIGWIASSMRISVGHAFGAAVVSEYLGSTQGIGYLVIYGQNVLLSSYVFAGLFVVIVLALILDMLVRTGQRILTPWDSSIR